MGIQAGIANRPIFGGNWNNGAQYGSRNANWNNRTLKLNSNHSSRGVAETEVLAGLTLRLAISALLNVSRIHYRDALRLVGFPEAGGRIL